MKKREGKYSIKCDDCRTEIRRTDSIIKSAEGGRCIGCRVKDAERRANAGHPEAMDELRKYAPKKAEKIAKRLAKERDFLMNY